MAQTKNEKFGKLAYFLAVAAGVVSVASGLLGLIKAYNWPKYSEYVGKGQAETISN